MARRELVAVAGRLLSFDREVDTDIAGLACRLALSTGDIEVAAGFLGYAEAREQPSRPTDVDECRHRIESSLVAGEGELLVAAGAATGRTQMLERILEWGAT